jgi:hypothetical protein
MRIMSLKPLAAVRSPILLTLAMLIAAACGQNTEYELDALTTEPLAFPVKVNKKFAVIDEKGNLTIPFENEYESILSADHKNTVWAKTAGKWSLISKDGRIIKANLFDDLAPMFPGFFRFSKNGKWGIVDVNGTIIRPAVYDHLDKFRYHIADKEGFLDAQGNEITEAVYKKCALCGEYYPINGTEGLILAERDGSPDENWVINTKTGEQRKVDYNSFLRYYEIDDNLEDVSGDYRHDYARVAYKTGKYHNKVKKIGLADRSGRLVIPAEDRRLGLPSEGLVAYYVGDEDSDPDGKNLRCGYLNLNNEVVIDTRFSECTPFGKKGAFARLPEGEFGFIDHTGQWIIEPRYSDVRYTNQAPGLVRVFSGVSWSFQQDWKREYGSFGVFDMDQGIEVIAPGTEYAIREILTPDLFVFTTKDAPRFMVRDASDRYVFTKRGSGLMNRAGKILIEPKRFHSLRMSDDKRFVLAKGDPRYPIYSLFDEIYTNLSPFVNHHDRIFLYDLDGNELFAAEWDRLAFEAENNILYSWGDQKRAVYIFPNKLLFSVRKTSFGTEQFLDRRGKVFSP